nr:unnamed protein product [Effrenium voratum]
MRGTSSAWTSFTPYSLECPPAPTYELQAIVKATQKANDAIGLAQDMGAEKAARLAKRAVDHIGQVKGWFTYYVYRVYTDLQDDIHQARFDMEQAAQSAYSEATGSEAGNLLSCAADDLLPYDPLPNIHPMDHRLSSIPLALCTGLPLERRRRGIEGGSMDLLPAWLSLIKMMCLFKPNTYDPKDWQCPKPSCRTVNFKKRLTCISCGARKPEGSNRPLDDWRDGEKVSAGPWTCECSCKNEGGAMYCMQCKQPSPDMRRAIEEEKQQRAADEGRGGGLFDRQDPNDRNAWDSDDEEVDEFGRRKKVKRSRGGDKPKACRDKHKAALERLRPEPEFVIRSSLCWVLN